MQASCAELRMFRNLGVSATTHIAIENAIIPKTFSKNLIFKLLLKMYTYGDNCIGYSKEIP